MAVQLLSASAAATLLIVVVSAFIMRWLRRPQTLRVAEKHDQLDLTNRSQEPAVLLIKSLASALPDSVVLPHDVAAFKRSVNAYWAKQEREVMPACVVRPHDVQQLSTAVTILKREYDERRKRAGGENPGGLFAVRSGGHSPVSCAASIKGGVVIDLSLFCEVTPSDDGSSVVIGVGARWGNVYDVLEEKGLAVAGGRNSDVGVGGLTLGGGLSFFSPRFGLVCSNILSYEVVLASGSVVTASASANPDLWRALKGGSNNFGIVTRITARSFPSSKIWSGLLYMPSFQATKTIAAFHEYVNRADSGDLGTSFEQYAAGPLACFTYLQDLGFHLVSVNLVHTNPPENQREWPLCWRTTPFKSFWRYWSTCRIRTLSNATKELCSLNPPGQRQAQGATVIKNDLATLAAAHAAHLDAIAAIRRAKVKGCSWTLVLQPLLPRWARKGDPNPLGLQDAADDEPLVIASFAINWPERRHDAVVQETARRAVEQIEAVATKNGTGHRFRYLNYCAGWQRPLESYGEENLRFMRTVSGKYDPDGLFQKACVGGFKLDMNDEA